MFQRDPLSLIPSSFSLTLHLNSQAIAAAMAGYGRPDARRWPDTVRVALKGARGAGDDDAPRLVRFPPPNAPGGVFASLQVRALPSPLQGSSLGRYRPSLWGNGTPRLCHL